MGVKIENMLHEMMKFFLILVIFCVLLPSSSSMSTSSIRIGTLASISQGKSTSLCGDGNVQYWAVIITVGEALRDGHGSNALTNILLSHDCPIDHIKEIVEENATKEAILQVPFAWLQTQNIDDDDIVIFYFSMHGSQIDDQYPLDEPDMYDEYVVPFDYDAGNLSTYLFDEELSEKFNTLDLTNLLIIFETCNSGGMIDGSADLSGSGRVIMTSCAADESSWPMYFWRHWMFPHFLFRGLIGFADLNRDKMITAEEAFFYAETPTILRSTIYAKLFSLIPFIPHDFFPQHPQLYDGWPTEENNTEELMLF